MAIHRLLHCLAPRRILDLLVENRADDVEASLPNHLRAEFGVIRDKIVTQLDELLREAQAVFRYRRALLDESRKSYALGLRDQPGHLKTLLFALADGRDPWPLAAKCRSPPYLVTATGWVPDLSRDQSARKFPVMP